MWTLTDNNDDNSSMKEMDITLPEGAEVEVYVRSTEIPNAPPVPLKMPQISRVRIKMPDVE